MELNLRTTNYLAELTVDTGEAKIKFDISSYEGGKVGYRIPDSIMENFATTLFEMSRFNNVNDVDFIKSLCDAFLSDEERRTFLELINEDYGKEN